MNLVNLINQSAYIILFLGTFSLVIASVFIAHFAMKRGITYETMRATMWAILFTGLGNTWHTLAFGLFAFNMPFGDSPRILEYSLYIIGYLLFIKIAIKMSQVKVPN